MEIKDNELLRQFEIITSTGLVAIEYSIQERKLFLTKFCSNKNEDEAAAHGGQQVPRAQVETT